MKIEIEIPKEFEEHFNQDKFKDSLERIMADIKYSLENGDYLCCKYEYGTIEMLEKAFENSKNAYDVDKVVERLELHSFELGTDTLPAHYVRLNDAIEIVKQGGVDDDVCEWKLDGDNLTTGCGDYFNLYDNCTGKFKYCPRCGKKIKAVE